MITNFWNWITSSIGFGLQTLNNFINNTTTGPFFNLLLVILLIGVLIKFIVFPLLGNSFNRGSDKVRRKEED